jgi:hypothetical protein
MVRLPDIPVQSWLDYTQERFKEATDGLLPSLDFQLGAQDQEAQIPPDFDAPGGIDQWQEAERKQIEDESRQAQQRSEEQHQQEIAAQAEQYRQQQAQAEQARQDEQRAQEDQVMQSIQAAGIPTPSDAFAAFEPPGDHTSSAALAPPAEQPVSPVDQFNAHANDVMAGTFGEPPAPPDQLPPDHTSTTGILDRLNPSRLAQEAGEDIGRFGSAITGNIRSTVENAPAALSTMYETGRPVPPHTESDQALQESIRSVGEPVQSALGSAASTLEEASGSPTGTVSQAVQDVSSVLGPGSGAEILGMIGRGGKEISPASIRAIQDLRANPAITEDVIVGLERALAEGSDVALSAVQRLTRGTPEEAAVPRDVPNPWPLTDEERALNAQADTEAASRPAHGGYLAEDVANPELATSASASEIPGETRALTPEEAIQQRLPGFEDVLERPAPRENIRGFGTVPEEPMPAENVIRGMNAEQAAARQPYTLAGLHEQAANLIEADPEAVAPILARRLGEDPLRAGVEQTLLKENVQTWGQAFERALADHQDIQQQIKTHAEAFGKQSIPAEMLDEAADRSTTLGLITNELRMAVKGQSASARAYSTGLNAQRGGLLGARALNAAERLQDVAETMGQTAGVLRKVVQDPASVVTPEAQQSMRKLLNKLTDRTIKTVGEHTTVQEEATRYGQTTAEGRLRAAQVAAREGRTGAGAGGTSPPTTGGTRPPIPEPPREETLAEALGRLKRQQGRLEDSGLSADHPDLVEVRHGIEDVTSQMRDEAEKIAEQRLGSSAKRVDLTASQAEQVINAAIGRRTQARIRGEAMAEAKGFRTPEVEATKLTAATEKALQRAIDRHARDTEKLQQSIDVQIQRRVDGALAQERRATVRTEIKGMAKEAQTLANKIRKFPEHRAAFQESLDEILGRMSEHSNVGERVANDLRERLGVNLQEDVYQRAFREEKRASDALTASRLRGIQQQLRDALATPQAPGRGERIAQLYQDMAEVSPAGLRKAESMRKTAWMAGIDRAGYNVKEAGKEGLADILLAMDHQDPKMMRAALNTMIRPSLWKVWREISFINMLSAPTTHIWNVTSTTLNAMLKTMLRDPLEFVFSGGESTGVMAGLKGTLGRQAWKEGGALAGQTMRSGINPERFSSSIATGNFHHVGQEYLPQVLEAKLGKLGRAIGVLYHVGSTRPLEAMDAMMGHMVYGGAIAREAQQEADNLIRSGKDLSWMTTPGDTRPLREQAMNYILDNPWDYPDLQKRAGTIQDYVLYRTRGTSKFEVALRAFMGQKEITPESPLTEKLAAYAIDFIMPFWNVPFNFTKQGVGNVIAPVWNTAAGIGYAVKGDAALQGQHLAKAVQGGAMLGIAGALVSGDNLTASGPQDPGDRRVWGEDHKPFSFRWPGTKNWISYESSPMAIPFATIAGASENLQYNQKADPTMTREDQVAAAIAGGAQGAAQGALSQSFIQAAERNFQFLLGQGAGPNNLSQALAGNAARYFSPVPMGFVNFLAGMTDTVERDTGRAQNLSDVISLNENNLPYPGENLRNRLQMRIPGRGVDLPGTDLGIPGRQALPERTGAYGETIPNTRAGGMALVPMQRGPGTREGDPVTQQLERGSVGIPTAPKEIRFSPTTTMPLTIREQEDFQRIYGERYRHLLEAQGAGTRTMSEYNLTRLRDLARQQASEAVRLSIPEDERRRRVVHTPREQVAP